jgi:hypothetical protein
MRINGYVVITNLTKKSAVRKVGRKVDIDRVSPLTTTLCPSFFRCMLVMTSSLFNVHSHPRLCSFIVYVIPQGAAKLRLGCGVAQTRERCSSDGSPFDSNSILGSTLQ